MTRKVPNVRVRGIRQKIPQGYFVGRVEKGDGRAQLISSAELRRALGLTPAEVTGVVTDTILPIVGFMALGATDDGEFLGFVPFTRSITFPANFAGAVGVALQLGTASAVYTVKKLTAAGVLSTIGTV